MKIVFISNFFNHHQKQLSDELFRLTEGKYAFFATEKMPAERKKLGWMIDFPAYVKEVGRELTEETQREIDEADAVILGGEPYAFVKNRIKQGKIVFLYTERLYKKKIGLLRRIKSILFRAPKWRKKNAHLLCAGAYVYSDFLSLGCFKDCAYQWGYFPPVSNAPTWAEKETNSLLWCARLIDWKHPEVAIAIAKRLKEDGYTFTLRMIGEGELAEEIRRTIEREGLQTCVSLAGAMSFDEVRREMEKSQIYLFTSDAEEGWGAVLNESMNAGMAVVASHEIGATPYLIKDGENGIVYESGNTDDLYAKVKSLLDEKEKAQQLGKKAAQTILEKWNGQAAATRLISLIKNLQEGKNTPFSDGPCAKAPILKEDWYKGENR